MITRRHLIARAFSSQLRRSCTGSWVYYLCVKALMQIFRLLLYSFIHMVLHSDILAGGRRIGHKSDTLVGLTDKEAYLQKSPGGREAEMVKMEVEMVKMDA